LRPSGWGRLVGIVAGALISGILSVLRRLPDDVVAEAHRALAGPPQAVARPAAVHYVEAAPAVSRRSAGAAP
jgi:hypothetical protein